MNNAGIHGWTGSQMMPERPLSYSKTKTNCTPEFKTPVNGDYLIVRAYRYRQLIIGLFSQRRQFLNFERNFNLGKLLKQKADANYFRDQLHFLEAESAKTDAEIRAKQQQIRNRSHEERMKKLMGPLTGNATRVPADSAEESDNEKADEKVQEDSLEDQIARLQDQSKLTINWLLDFQRSQTEIEQPVVGALSAAALAARSETEAGGSAAGEGSAGGQPEHSIGDEIVRKEENLPFPDQVSQALYLMPAGKDPWVDSPTYTLEVEPDFADSPDAWKDAPAYKAVNPQREWPYGHFERPRLAGKPRAPRARVAQIFRNQLAAEFANLAYDWTSVDILY